MPASEEIVFKNIEGNAIELNLEIENNNVLLLELNVLRSPDKEECIRIVFMKNRGNGGGCHHRPGEIQSGPSKLPPPRFPVLPSRESLIATESSRSSLHPDVTPRGSEMAPFNLDKEGNLKLSVFIDKSVADVFVNGKQALSLRVCPSCEDAVGVALRSQGKPSQLKRPEARQMKSI